ncbi:MAG: HDOD domain-containing protein [Actinomycetota bacterium]
MIEHSYTRTNVDIDLLVKLKLPPLNQSVMRISELLRDENVSTKKLANVVGFDPILAVRLLKLANSSLYARQKAATSIQQAIEAIGLKSLYDIVMLGAMADGFAKEIGNMVYGRIVWEHSIAVGLLSREISNIIGLRGTEEAFLCGLLHDIGKILLLRGEPQLFESFIDITSEIEMLEGEEKVFGLTHAEIGAYVTHKWELPEVVCGVIMHHHNPSRATISTVMTNVVNAADLIANINGYGIRVEDENEIFRSESVAFLNLNKLQINTAWENIQGSLLEVLSTFR